MGRTSKRKSSRGTASAPPAKRPKSQWSSTPFGRMVEAAGLILSGGEEANELTVEPAHFQRKLSTAFRRHSNIDEALEQFCDGLSEYIDNPVRFRMCLLPTRVAEGADVLARSTGLDSLMRLLLGVECVQPSVANTLLEKMPEYMDDAGNVDALDLHEYHQMPQLILNQMKWLNHVVEGKELCTKLMEVVSIAPVGTQREIVSALPEILEDAQHNDAATQLKSLLETNSELTSAVIDALSNFNVGTELAAEVLDVALGRVASADLADLPAVIKFVVQHVTPRNAQEVISELREKLEFESTFIPPPNASSTPRSTQRHTARVSAEASDQFVVFDTIRSSICFQKAVADGWMKAIELVSSAGDHKVIDVFVLFILHSISARKKNVEGLFCSKVKARLFTDELMATVFGSHAGALREFFPNVLSLCESLLCHSSPSISSFASLLYQHVFRTFDVYCQQEVVGALVTHIGSGMPSEINHALDVLGALVESQRKAMHRFAIMIKGVLDYLEQLSVSQIRRLYSVLSVLAFQDPTEGSSIQDEMHTLIRKQLSHGEPKYRRMGVIGAVMILQQVAHRREEGDMSFHTQRTSQANPEGSTLTPARWRQATSMLTDVMKSCSKSPESTILFCDEMASVVQQGNMDPAVLHHLSEEVTSRFQDDFLIETKESLPSDGGLPFQPLLSLDSSEEGSIALNLLPMVTKQSDRGQERGSAVRALAAHFHLLRMCEQAIHDSLEGIDALLGCPVVMCPVEKLKAEVFEDLPLSKRQDVCLALFHCLNWFRELVCAFAGESDADMKGKVVTRLRNITELQTQLESCMAAVPGFLPPCVTAEEVSPPTRGRKGKSAKSDTTLASTTCATQNIDKDTTAVDRSASTSTVPIDRLRPYFRPLDLGAFFPLHYGTLSRTVVDSEMHTREREEVVLQPPQLLFLLQDLNAKLSATFSVFGTKGTAKSGSGVSFTAGQLVSTMTGLLPGLCEQLENTTAFFQAQQVENDGIVDMGSRHPDYETQCSCLTLLLRTLATFLGWPSLSDPHYEEQLVSCLQTLAARTGQGSSQPQAGTAGLAKAACKYFDHFSEFLPSITCAHVLAKLLVAVCKTCQAELLRPSIASMCCRLLKQSWAMVEGTSQRKEALEFLLRYHIEWAEDPLQVVETIAGEGVSELLGEEAEEESSTYHTLTSGTFPNYYRCMMSAVVTQIKIIPAPSKKSIPSEEVLTDRLQLLAISAKVLFMLVSLVKSFDRRSVLSTALKYGRMYVEAFLKSGMPVLDSLFRQRKDDVMDLLKTLQQSTRCLHHFCNHSKVAKDITLTNHVPQLKKCLEMLIFRVKELLTNHNCREAFWLGNLKNRDLQGQEILSQAPTEAQNGQEEESGEEGTITSTSTDRRDEEIEEEESD